MTLIASAIIDVVRYGLSSQKPSDYSMLYLDHLLSPSSPFCVRSLNNLWGFIASAGVNAHDKAKEEPSVSIAMHSLRGQHVGAPPVIVIATLGAGMRRDLYCIAKGSNICNFHNDLSTTLVTDQSHPNPFLFPWKMK